MRSKVEIETEFLQFSNPKYKTIVIEIESNKTERKRSEFSFPKTKKLKFTQYQKLSENYYENSKKKAPRRTWILSYLYTFQNDLQALSWAFVLGGIGLKEALVDCSWRLKKNRSEPIEPVLKLAIVGPNVRAKVRGLTLTLTFHSSKHNSLVWTLVPTLGV